MKKYYYGIKELRFSYRDCDGLHTGEMAIIVGDKIVCHCRYGELQPRDCTFEISQETWKAFVDKLVKKHKVFHLNEKMLKDGFSEFDDDLDVHLYIKRTLWRNIDLHAELGNYYMAPIFYLIQQHILANKKCHCQKCNCMSEFRVHYGII